MAIHKYRVRPGFTYGAFRQYTAGTIVELDDEVAKHSMDKLELAEVIQSVQLTPESPPDPGEAVPSDQEETTADETGVEQPSLPAAPRRTLRKPKAGD